MIDADGRPFPFELIPFVEEVHGIGPLKAFRIGQQQQDAPQVV